MIATLGPTSPPKRSPIPVPHLSAGRYLISQRYTVGWPERGVVKIGCTWSTRRVRRFSRSRGAELIDLAHYPNIYDDVRSEVWLQQAVGATWPAAFRCKDDARPLMGSNTDGWTEFYAIPVEDWPELRRLAAI